MSSGPDSISVTVTLGDRRLTLEGPADFVRAEVQRLTNLVASGGSASRANDPENLISSGPMSEASFINVKRPANHSETVAVLAYCLKQKGTLEFDEQEISRAYKRARVKPPKVVAQAIRDAKNVFDYIETGAKRGFFRLSRFGETTVEFDLPRQGDHKG
jgi:hypothetical protein